MATYREEIIGLIEPVIESEGLELVELECLRMKTRWLVRIYIDREGGATLEDCTAMSHQVGDLLNVHDLPPGPYTLEVSTPGLDRPLTRDKDFEKYRGGRVRIRTREPIDGSRLRTTFSLPTSDSATSSAKADGPSWLIVAG